LGIRGRHIWLRELRDVFNGRPYTGDRGEGKDEEERRKERKKKKKKLDLVVISFVQQRG
jgi:hypothetical protein